ncbi:MAG: glycosyltransferase [Thermoleophilia bacterium]|nr:glycosyltransferase [Thermoleophilia bacterium]
MSTVRIHIDGSCRPAFVPRARWVCEVLMDGLGLTPEFTEGDGDIVYAPTRPSAGIWIPMQHDAQEWFEGPGAFPSAAVHYATGLTLLFPPCAAAESIPGDLVASAFYLLARWDEYRVADRDRFGRLPFARSAFGVIEGLDIEDPAVEGYLATLRRALARPDPTAWTVYLTHDIDRIRRRTPKGLARAVKHKGLGAVRDLTGHDPWNNLPDLLETTWRRGLRATVFLIGRNAHTRDGTPRRTYERQRQSLAAAVHAAGGEVALHAAFASSESGEALRAELDVLRQEAGDVRGVRFHYLRFRYHDTPLRVERAGLGYDASLGFSERPGFAAGYARPFRPWIVGEERAANIVLVPLAVMDTTLHAHLGLTADEARERALTVLDVVRRVGGRVALLWHNTYLADDRAPGYGRLWEELLDELQARGATMGPISPDAPAPGARLDGRRVVHITSVHRPRDVRIFHKEVQALVAAGAEASVLALDTPVRRRRRVRAGWDLMRRARTMNADVYHVHDPELLPAAMWLHRVTGTPVVYDAHEYLGETVRTKGWIPGPLRRPLAAVAAAAERTAARRLSGVVTANEDLAARFAGAGCTAVSVTNSPWADAFGEAAAPEDGLVVYIGGLGPLRGLPLMLEAFPRVGVVGARLLLVGPGDPGDLPPNVEHIAAVDHSEVPGLLARAAVAWIPLRHHGNYDRAVPTKLVEAMAMGRPVVASDLTRMAAIVRTVGCGIVVPADDADAHAEGIRTLLQDPVRARAMGDAGRRAFLDGLTFEREADALTSFYAEVLG